MTSGYAAIVLYDFTGEVPGDLTVTAGEEVTILPHLGADEGWVQATNMAGEQGILPESYTEPLDQEDQTEEEEEDDFQFDRNTWNDDIEDYEQRYENFQDPGTLSLARGPRSRRRVPGSADEMSISVDNASLMTKWEAPPSSSPGYTCSLGQGKKVTKFGGITSFVQFPLTPTSSNIQVSRR